MADGRGVADAYARGKDASLSGAAHREHREFELLATRAAGALMRRNT
jgi:hypothetical protein